MTHPNESHIILSEPLKPDERRVKQVKHPLSKRFASVARSSSLKGAGRSKLCSVALTGAASMLCLAAITVVVGPPNTLPLRNVVSDAAAPVPAHVPKVLVSPFPSFATPVAAVVSTSTSEVIMLRPTQQVAVPSKWVELGSLLQDPPPPTERPPGVGMPNCTGHATGGPLISPSNHRRPESVLNKPIPTTFALPTTRVCRAIPNTSTSVESLVVPATQRATAPAPVGLDALTTFGNMHGLKPRCDIGSLRRWGGFPIPSNPCENDGAKIFPGVSHFAEQDNSEVGWASFESSKDDAAHVNGTVLARIAWLPSLRKCGSTMLVKYFQHARKKSNNLARDTIKHPLRWSDDDIQRLFFKFAVVRDPLDHFLAGVHQLYVFYRMGWLARLQSRWGVEFWNRTCVSTTFGSPDKLAKCAGAPGGGPIEVLEAVLDDIERIGFFDAHIFPMTYPIALSRSVDGVGSPNFYIFNLDDIDGLMNVLNVVLYNQSQWQHRYTRPLGPKPMHRGNTEITPWVIRAPDLLARAETECKARNVVQRFCRLYAEDYRCLPFTIPRVCRDDR